MRIVKLSDTQKYELLLSILEGKPMDFNSPVGHLVIDYMPEWDEFAEKVQDNITAQVDMGGSWSCYDCKTLRDHIVGINKLTHRTPDHDDSDEGSFTCNCSYCQIVTGRSCDCGRCALKTGISYKYKDYITGSTREVTVAENDEFLTRVEYTI